MQELHEGNKAALDIIMERWELPIKAYIYRMTQAPDWVDELSQETFVKVYINASGFDVSRRFSPWIYTIATNLCRNWRRWRSRHPSLPQTHNQFSEKTENWVENLKDPSPEVSKSMEQKEHCAEVKSALESLPETLQTALILYYYQGLSYEEIAEVTHCSRRGVETRLYRAKKLLQPKLSKLMTV